MVPWAHPSFHPKLHLDWFSRFCTGHRRVTHYFTMGRYVFLQNCLCSLGDRVLHLTRGTYGSPESPLQTHLDRLSRFCMGPKCCAVECIVNAPEIAPSLGILSPRQKSSEPRPSATCTKKLVKIARLVWEIFSRTDIQTDI